MKVSKYRDIIFLMNQELLVNYQSLSNDLAFSMAVFSIMLGKDELPVEKKITDESSANVSRMQSMIFPLISNTPYNDEDFIESLTNTKVYPLNLVDDLNEAISCQNQSQDLDPALFDPYDQDLDCFKEEVQEFLKRLVMIYRLRFWLKDITEGIEQYGVVAYTVPDDDNDSAADILAGLEEETHQSLLTELSHYLVTTLEDEDDEKADKINLVSVITVIKKLTGEK